MRDRVVAIALTVGLVVGVTGAALVAAGDEAESREQLPLAALGTGTDEASASADRAAAGMTMASSVEYVVDGDLDELEGEAPAWRLGRQYAVARVSALAAALGLEGRVTDTEFGWVVQDGSRRLEVTDQAGLPWWYGESVGTGVTEPDGSGVDPVPPSTGGSVGGGASSAGSTGSAGAEEARRAEAASGSGSGVVSDKDEVPSNPGGDTPVSSDDVACLAPSPDVVCGPTTPPADVDLPSRAEAEAVAREILDAAGIGQAVLRVDDVVTALMVTADPIVDGLPTNGYSTTVSVGERARVEWASGWLADAERGDTYPLIGTTAALRRLQESTTGVATGGIEPAIEPAAEPAIAECVGGPAVDCAPSEPFVVTITGARLGLQFVPSYDGREAWLVPSYLFETEHGGPTSEIPVMAVGDEDIAAPPPAPVDPDEPVGTEPGDPGDPEPTPAPPTSVVVVDQQGTCSTVSAGTTTLEVCATPAEVGQPVVFTLVATDTAAEVADDCSSPTFDPEGSGEVAVCDIGFLPRPTPDELRRSFEHTYTRPGDYEALFTVNHSRGDPLVVPVPVTVR